MSYTKQISYTKLKQDLIKVLEEIENNKSHYLITRKNSPNIVMLLEDQFKVLTKEK